MHDALTKFPQKQKQKVFDKVNLMGRIIALILKLMMCNSKSSFSPSCFGCLNISNFAYFLCVGARLLSKDNCLKLNNVLYLSNIQRRFHIIRRAKFSSSMSSKMKRKRERKKKVDKCDLLRVFCILPLK